MSFRTDRSLCINIDVERMFVGKVQVIKKPCKVIKGGVAS